MKYQKILLITLLIISLSACKTDKKVSYYHVLLLEYAEDTPFTEISNDVLHFKDIPDVIDVAIGKIKPNERNAFSNFNYSVVLTFRDKQGLDNYLKHPYHQKIYTKHKPFIKAIYTADFEPIDMNSH